MTGDFLQGVINEDTLLVPKTLRSGQSIRHTGHVVVLGDVNPGGEIIADGDVIILGAARGVIHAGAKGDLTATITAFYLNPTQLRIGKLISCPPEEDRIYPTYPETARVLEDNLVIEKYQPAR